MHLPTYFWCAAQKPTATDAMTPPENKMDKPQVPTPNLAPALWLEILKLPFVLILVAFVCLIVGNFFGALPTEFSGGGVSMKFEKRVKQADSNLNNKVQVLSIMLADMQAQQDSLTKVIRGLNGAGQGKAKMPSVATATSIDLPTPTDNLQAALVKVIADDNAHATSLKGKVGWIFIGDSVPGNPLRHGQVADANMQYIATPLPGHPCPHRFPRQKAT